MKHQEEDNQKSDSPSRYVHRNNKNNIVRIAQVWFTENPDQVP